MTFTLIPQLDTGFRRYGHHPATSRSMVTISRSICWMSASIASELTNRRGLMTSPDGLRFAHLLVTYAEILCRSALARQPATCRSIAPSRSTGCRPRLLRGAGVAVGRQRAAKEITGDVANFRPPDLSGPEVIRR